MSFQLSIVNFSFTMLHCRRTTGGCKYWLIMVPLTLQTARSHSGYWSYTAIIPTTYLTDSVKSLGLLELCLARKLPSYPRSFNSSSAYLTDRVKSLGLLELSLRTLQTVWNRSGYWSYAWPRNCHHTHVLSIVPQLSVLWYVDGTIWNYIVKIFTISIRCAKW